MDLNAQMQELLNKNDALLDKLFALIDPQDHEEATEILNKHGHGALFAALNVKRDSLGAAFPKSP